MSRVNTALSPNSTHGSTINYAYKEERDRISKDRSNSNNYHILVEGLIYCLIHFSLRRRRSSDSMKNLIGNPQFSDDMVQIVSGYPRLSPDDPSITLLAFYLQLPGGVGDNLVSEDVLKNIVKSDIKSIEGSMGVSITTVQSMPSTKNEVDQEDETDDKGSISTSVIVGVTLGSLSLLGILIAVNLFIKSNRYKSLF